MKIVTKSQENQRNGGKTYKKKLQKINKMARTYILIIILHRNGLNSSTKKLTVYNKDLYICCLQETHFRSRDTDRLKLRG